MRAQEARGSQQGHGVCLAAGSGGLHCMPCMRSCSAVLSIAPHVQAPRLLPRWLTPEAAPAPAGWLGAEAAAAPAAGRNPARPAAPRLLGTAVEPFGPAGRMSGLDLDGIYSPQLEQTMAPLSAILFGPAGGGGVGPRRAVSPDVALGELVFPPAAAGAVGPQLAGGAFGAGGAVSAPSLAARGFSSPQLGAAAAPRMAGELAAPQVAAAASGFAAEPGAVARGFTAHARDADLGWVAPGAAVARRGPRPSQGAGGLPLAYPLEWGSRRSRHWSIAQGPMPACPSAPLAAPAFPGLTGELAWQPAPAAGGGSGNQLGAVFRGLSAEISDSAVEAFFAPKRAAAGGRSPPSQDAGGPPLVRPASTPLRASVVQHASAWLSRLHVSEPLCIGTALHSPVCMSLHGHRAACWVGGPSTCASEWR